MSDVSLVKSVSFKSQDLEAEERPYYRIQVLPLTGSLWLWEAHPPLQTCHQGDLKALRRGRKPSGSAAAIRALPRCLELAVRLEVSGEQNWVSRLIVVEGVEVSAGGL